MKPSKKETKITIRVDAETNKALLALAKIDDRVISDFIRHQLKKVIEDRKKELV